jgi:hypothetical protein
MFPPRSGLRVRAERGPWPRDLDLLISILPIEKSWYAERFPSFRVEFVGHPIVDRHPDAARAVEVPANPPRVLLLPGSRLSEIARHWPLMVEAARLVQAQTPVDWQAVFLDDARKSAALAADGATGLPLTCVVGGLSVGPISRLPVSIRIVLESVLRNCDGKRSAKPTCANRQLEAQRGAHGGNPLRRRPHRVAGFHRRAAARRSRRHAQRRRQASARTRRSSNRSCPWTSSSITRCRWISPAARIRPGEEPRSRIQRNRERYQFLKWGMQAFDTFKVVPPASASSIR